MCSDIDRVPLSSELEEFRQALEAEIEAARQNSAESAIPLEGGRRLARIGEVYQYQFKIENAFAVQTLARLPSDAPAVLIANGQRLDVLVVSVAGLAIVLGVQTDLDAFVSQAKLTVDLTLLLKKLIDRIEKLSSQPNEVGDRLLGKLGVSGEAKDIPVGGRFNSEQKAAIQSSLGKDLTFILGPPGTGKTDVIGGIGKEFVAAGRSLLMVSHTNTAVDQAVERIGRSVSSDLRAAGRVLRVGDPSEDTVPVDLLLSHHVELRTAGLISEKQQVEVDLSRVMGALFEVSRLIDIAEWLENVQPDVAYFCAKHETILGLRQGIRQLREMLMSVSSESDLWRERLDTATKVLRSLKQKESLEAELRALSVRLDHLRVKEAKCRQEVEWQESCLSLSESLESARSQLDRLPAEGDLQSMSSRCEADVSAAREAIEASKADLAEAQRLLEEARSVGKLTRMWRKLPDPSTLEARVEEIGKDLSERQEAGRRCMSRLEFASTQLRTVQRLTAQVREHEDVPRLEQQRSRCDFARDALEACMTELSIAKGDLRVANESLRLVEERLAEYKGSYDTPPEELFAQAQHHLEEENRLSNLLQNKTKECGAEEAALWDELEPRVQVLLEWELTAQEATSVDGLLEALLGAVVTAKNEYGQRSMTELRAQAANFTKEVENLKVRLAELDTEISMVEANLIADADVIATTLTRAYLREALHARRFDTVVLDEASMAPVPALWAAVGLASRNAVVVGDPSQLAPIVLSKEDVAQRWLGRDIFDISGVELGSSPLSSALVKLREQFRMHPQICELANVMFYGGDLRDGDPESASQPPSEWYNQSWGWDAPILLADTGPLNAWVTSIPRGRGSSRLNFLSAVLCVDIAKQMLHEERRKWAQTERSRILIVSPYRPHANLLKILLTEDELWGEVSAGTVHSFQGSEADVVILDLVVDEPHWRVGLFNSDYDDSNGRLLNVAVTRAKRRLVIVGDSEYIQKKGKKALLGRSMIPWLEEEARIVDSRKCLRQGWAQRSDKARSDFQGGPLEPDSARTVVTQESFYQMLSVDLAQAKDTIVIFSAFLTENRIQQIYPSLRSAIEGGVRIFVVTKPLNERRVRERTQYQYLETVLSDWGIVIVHKRGMHEKLVIVDKEILWTGSLNPLSFSDTQEVMERRRSSRVVSDYWSTMRLDELLSEYEEAAPACPLCGSEVYAKEGRDDPYYWACEQANCYSRSIDEPKLKDEEIRCQRCGASVRFGSWGGEPYWRCTENARHRQKVAKTHLRVPSIRTQIPVADLRRLEKKWRLKKAVLPRLN